MRSYEKFVKYDQGKFQSKYEYKFGKNLRDRRLFAKVRL